VKPLVYKKSKRKPKAEVLRPPKMRITRGDRVRVIRGEDRGKEGTVIRVLLKQNRVVVDGVNVLTKHQRPTPAAEGGIITRPGPIHASNVMLLDPKSGDPTRVRRKKDKDGTLERLSVRSDQPISRNR
jgi:large subunit ribosomal protein L24